MAVRELSVFVDESGDLGAESKYYMLALIFHDQSEDLSEVLSQYQLTLRERRLENLPLHMNPLLRGNEAYANMDTHHRERLLTAFATFAHKCPFTYHVIAYRKDRFVDTSALGAQLRRDIVELLFAHLEWFQRFDLVKIYYDDGQRLVTRALHDGFEYALAREAVLYRDARPSDNRMLQIADYVCGVELAALKYDAREEDATDRIFFGKRRDFMRTFLRKLRKHRV